MSFLSALNPNARDAIRALEQRMRRFYANPDYHAEWIRGANAHWQPGTHDAQLALTTRIPAAAQLLEIGCGDTSAGSEFHQRVRELRYFGVDITIPPERNRALRAAAASGLALPFSAESFEIVVSMFTIEHTLFPQQFLDEAWRVLRHGGKLCIIAPDFLHNAMASERIGLSYGNGREKLRNRQLIDAALTFYDSRLRLPAARHKRKRALNSGSYEFPILMNPRCLSHPGFVTDCDAVYPSCPEEIGNYLRAQYELHSETVFFRDAHTFGIELVK